MRSRKSVFLLIIFTILTISSLHLITPQIVAQPQAPQYTIISSPIVIDGDTNFTATAGNFGWPGAGTQGSPYIIDDVEIQGLSSDTLLSIQNTNVYFVIRNSFFNGSSIGISLDNAHNGNISDNIITYQMNNGIKLLDSDNNLISHNEISHTSRALYLTSSSFNNIVNNTIHDNSAESIFIGSSFYLNINYNKLYASDQGLEIQFSSLNNVTGNTAYDNTNDGMLIWRYTSTLDSPTRVWDNTVFNNTNGIWIDRMYNITVWNNTVHQNTYGIRTNAGERNEFFNNIIYDNVYGFSIKNPDFPNIYGHNLVNNGFFFEIATPIFTFNFNINIHENNTVNGKPIAFFNHTVGGTVAGDFGQIILFNSTQMTVENNQMHGASVGVLLILSDFITVQNNTLSNHSQGIGVYHSQNITIQNNTIFGSPNYGIYVYGTNGDESNNITIAQNEVYLNNEGIYGTYTDFTTIKNNSIHHSLQNGLYHEWSNNVSIAYNVIYSNGYNSSLTEFSNTNVEYPFSKATSTVSHEPVINYDFEDNGVSLSTLTDSSLIGNTFLENAGYGSYIDGGVNIIVDNNDFIKNNVSKYPNATRQLYSSNNDTVLLNYFSDASTCGQPYSIQYQDQLLETQCSSQYVANHHVLTTPELTYSVFINAGLIQNLNLKWTDSWDTLGHTVYYDVIVKSFDLIIKTVLNYEDVLFNEKIIDFTDTALASGTYLVLLVAYDKEGLTVSTAKIIALTDVYQFSPPTTTATSPPSTTTPPITITPPVEHTLSSFTIFTYGPNDIGDEFSPAGTFNLEYQSGQILWASAVDSLGHEVFYDIYLRPAGTDSDWVLLEEMFILETLPDGEAAGYSLDFAELELRIGEYEIQIRAYDDFGLERIETIKFAVTLGVSSTSPGFIVVLATLLMLVPIFRRRNNPR